MFYISESVPIEEWTNESFYYFCLSSSGAEAKWKQALIARI